MARVKYKKGQDMAKVKMACGHHDSVKVPPYKDTPGVVGYLKISEARRKPCSNCRKLEVLGGRNGHC